MAAKVHLSLFQELVVGEQIVMGVVADIAQVQGMTPGDSSTAQDIPLPHEIEVALPGGEHVAFTALKGYRKK